MGEKTGDTLLIKCIEYMAPEGGVGGLGLSYKEKNQLLQRTESIEVNPLKRSDVVTTGYSGVSMNVTDANSRMSRNQNIKYYIRITYSSRSK